MKDMVNHAYENKYAVGAFDLVGLEFLEAVINAAERCRSPVILSVAEPHFSHYNVELMMPAIEAAAQNASVPVSIQLDHGTSVTAVTNAIRLGCNGIMLDASNRALHDNIDATKEAVKVAHACGVPVVGEVGHVGKHFINGEGDEESSFTTPVEAKGFVEHTGIDFLSVSIGTTQGAEKGRIKVDFQRLKHINNEVAIPLVIHGGSSLSEDQIRRMTLLGVAKINYFTVMSALATQSLRDVVSRKNHNYFEYIHSTKDVVSDEVERCLRLLGSAGRAAEVVEQCLPWSSVHHIMLIQCKNTRADVEVVLAAGREALKPLPGVRRVYLARAVDTGNQYQYALNVNLVNAPALKQLKLHEVYTGIHEQLGRLSLVAPIDIDYESY